MAEDPAGRVSVLIPTYRRPGLLPHALESVLAQTAPPLEVLVGMDGPDDPSRALLVRAHRRDPRVVAVAFPHGGAYRVLNALLAAARGDRVAILADDDAWDPAFLERTARFDPDRLSLCYSDFLYDDGVSLRPSMSDERCREAREGLRRGCVVNLSAAVLSGPWLERLRVRDGLVFDVSFRTAGDWDLLLRLSRLAPIRHVCACLSRYGVHDGQLSRQRTLRMTYEEVRVRGKAGVPMRPREVLLRMRWLADAKLGLRKGMLTAEAP